MNRRFYITQPGRLSRKANTLKFEVKSQNSEKVFFIPVEQLEEIYVLSEVDFNRKVISFLGGKEIVVHFFSFSGAYVGSFLPRKGTGDSEVIVKEVDIYRDWNRRMQFARAFVKGAIRSMVIVLKARRLNREAERIAGFMDKVEGISTYNALLLEEARIWESYYSLWNKIITNEKFHISGRNRRPPEDPVNAMISFGNSLLYAFILNELYRTGLDPRIGYLHSVKKRRFGLNLDVAEIFKPLVVDRLIFRLVNKGQISTEDFFRPRRGVFLSRTGRRKFINAFERHLRSRVNIGRKYARFTYYGLIKRECQRLKKAILEDKLYEPINLEE